MIDEGGPMYAIDMSAISLDEFEQTLLSIELLPSRRILADHISSVAARLREREVGDLAGLQRLLKDKRRYPELAPELGVDEDYLVLLNREVNSYAVKPMPLAKLGYLSEAELAELAEVGVVSTKDLYERCAERADREAVGRETGITDDRLVAALELANLVRIVGVGPESARGFRDMGFRGPGDVLLADSEEICQRYADWTEATLGRRETLRPADIDYCKRYCVGLTEDIEW
jgi:hypothetical protein